MHDLETFEVSVLVVGGGPAGLTAAGALSRLGVDCLVVERRDSLSALPRATRSARGRWRSCGRGGSRTRCGPAASTTWSG